MIKVGMIGVGNMASSIAKTFDFTEVQLTLYSLDQALMGPLIDAGAKEVTWDEIVTELINPSDFVFIGVKPHQIESLFNDLNQHADSIQSSCAWVSMVASYSLSQLDQLLPNASQWIRIMPNTPVACGEGYTAYTHVPKLNESVLMSFQRLMTNAGVIAMHDEKYFDTITGLTGAGPAFIYQLIESMSDVGVAYGLSRSESHRMAAQVVKGAATMVLETELPPSVLKDQVTSPGGITIQGVLELEHAGFQSAIIRAIEKAIQTSKNMADG